MDQICVQCNAAVDAADNFCRHCGKDPRRITWYYKPLWIAILTLTVLGPFSIYLVWRSPALQAWGRWLATILILAFTLYLCNEAITIYKELPQILAALK